MPEGNVLCEWLRNSAESRPDAIALVEDERSVTFRGLFESAIAMAAGLVRTGVMPQDRILLACSKTANSITAVFATLFAGAICVPVHPRWPGERIEDTVQQCRARIVIRDKSSGLNVIDRATGAEIDFASQSDNAGIVLPRIDPTNPAMILFTSGSTGRPKGVVLTHNAVAAFVRWSGEEFGITSTDRIACPSPLGFDLSTFDIFNMALHGATCLIVSDDIVWMPRFLARFLRDQKVTCWYSVPSILSSMLEEGTLAKHSYDALRVVLFAGEVFPSHGIRRLQQVFPQARLANLYGPTETNVVTWATVPPNFDATQPIPIGTPCPYATVRLDDANGELLVGGASLMSGYWENPDETKRVLTTIDGVSYYRTGDHAAIVDGNYFFLGRIDRQVKRRGFRIELGEIEAALSRNSNVLEAAVIAAQSASAHTCIVAFVQPRSNQQMTINDVREHCASILPGYMLPDRLVLLDSIPKGTRGKTDYSALTRLVERTSDN